MPRPRLVSDVQIREALAHHGGNVTAAAVDLGIARNNLYKRIARSEINPAPLRAGCKRARMVTLKDEHVEELRQAKFDLQALLRVDLDESDILRRFFSDAFAGWLASALDRARSERSS